MKVLIYVEERLLTPTGGPAGYLYNVSKELKRQNISNIEFVKSSDSFMKKIFKKMPNSFQKYIRNKLNKGDNRVIYDVFYNKNKKAIVDLNKYDIVHFHSALSMYMVKDSLDSYNGKVLFTTHTPKISYKEIIEDYTSEEDYLKNKKEYDSLEIIDEYAFNRADYIILPAEEAEECYYNTWDKYNDIKEKNKSKYIYLPTCINSIINDSDVSETRKKYDIPENAFVICYIGRHNEVKGYDQLKKIGEKLLENRDDVYFLIAGKEEPLKGLINPRWIEVGWTDRPHDLAKCSNLFILPNKETYFDLILLEILSLGKTIILSDTGGNKYFKKFDTPSLIYYHYDDIDEAVSKIEDLINDNKLYIYEQMNRRIFEENFTMDIFVNNYIRILEEIFYNSKENNEKIN